MKNRIFFKLLAVFLIVIAATAAILYMMIGNAWEASLRAEIERNLKQKTLLFAHRVEIDHTHTLADIAAQEGQAAGARATVIDASGKVLADSESNPAQMENHAKRAEFAAALAGQTGENERRSATLGIPFLYVAAPISGGAVRLAYPLSDIEAVQAQVRRQLLWGSAIASLMALLIAAGASIWMSRRLQRIVDVAARIERGDLRPGCMRLPLDEIGRVAAAIDKTARAGRAKLRGGAFQPAATGNAAQQHAGRRDCGEPGWSRALGQPADGPPRSAAHAAERAGRGDDSRPRFSGRPSKQP